MLVESEEARGYDYFTPDVKNTRWCELRGVHIHVPVQQQYTKQQCNLTRKISAHQVPGMMYVQKMLNNVVQVVGRAFPSLDVELQASL